MKKEKDHQKILDMKNLKIKMFNNIKFHMNL